jgi:hypothetical protein
MGAVWACVWRKAGHRGGAGITEVTSNSSSGRFPVTVTHLRVTRCQICHRTVACRPGNLSEVLTGHCPAGPIPKRPASLPGSRPRRPSALLNPIFERDRSRQPDTSRGITGEPIVAVGGGGVFDEALQVEHYPGGDLLRANPRQGRVPR